MEHLTKREKLYIVGGAIGMWVVLILIKHFTGWQGIEGYIMQLVNYLNKGGSPVAFFAAFVEGLLFVGLYFPGSAVVITSVATAFPDVSTAVLRIFYAAAGFFLANTVNYFIGRFASVVMIEKFGMKQNLDDMEKKLVARGPKLILLSFFTPGIGAIVSAAAGALRFGYVQFAFYLTIALIFWDSLWGLIAFYFGSVIIAGIQKYLSYIAILALLIYGYRVYKRPEEIKNP